MATSTGTKLQAAPRTRYEDDLYTWVQEQVALLRAGRLTEIDTANVAEELEDVGKSELRSLESAIAVLAQHILNWDHQPTKRSRSWELSVREQRKQIEYILIDSPGLKSRVLSALERGYTIGRTRALSETKRAEDVMPEACPYTFDDMMTRPIHYQPRTPRRKKQR